MPQIDILTLFIFIIPGFIIVKTYYHFIKYKNNNQFEYFMLSLFWSLILSVFYGFIKITDDQELLFNNIYVAAVVLSLLGSIVVASPFISTYIFKRWLNHKK